LHAARVSAGRQRAHRIARGSRLKYPYPVGRTQSADSARAAARSGRRGSSTLPEQLTRSPIPLAIVFPWRSKYASRSLRSSRRRSRHHRLLTAVIERPRADLGDQALAEVLGAPGDLERALDLLHQPSSGSSIRPSTGCGPSPS
jgi:hypothetical protein